MTAVDVDVRPSAVLDDAHVGDIRGALGTIAVGDHAARTTLSAKLKTLLAIVGPGLIVMCGDNDAGAFSTYGQAGQNYGTRLLWTLLLLIPVLYVNQEMVLRLGAVTGVGHARLIMARFGKLWGTFEVIDLFLLNGLTIVTEFIGITLAASYLGVPKVVAVILAAGVIIATAFTGSFRAFERVAMAFCAGSLLLVPLYLMAHPSGSQMMRGFTTPGLPGGAAGGGMAAVMLLVIGIVGTTVAPWQLFFQQSYVIDKRITPRFMAYEKADLWIGIALVIIGAVAMIAFTAATFAGHPEMGQFTDAGAVADGIAKYIGATPSVLFSIALIDASIIGAAAVSLSTAYAIGDVLLLNHSLHRKPSEAKTFYSVYAVLIAISAALVLIPNAPLGIITNAVQTLAGILLPGASVFLLLLCNDKAVLGPWVNKPATNLFTGAVVAILVLLSIVLTASVLYPSITSTQIIAVLVGGAVLAAVGAIAVGIVRWRQPTATVPDSLIDKAEWRMPPLSKLPPAQMSLRRRLWLGVLRAYLAAALILAIVKVVELVLAKH